QKEKISNWLYDEYRIAYDKIGQAPDSRRNEEIVSAVYEKIEECFLVKNSMLPGRKQRCW
ncbi:MAG: hypothetical protein UD936_04445, partial [Acutalibacteraceae bacterium]|nr:hypothetical protein [Acutalibacteraceae bacterium]